MLFEFDDFELDAERLELRRGGTLVSVDAQALRVLSVLVRHAGRLVSKDELVDEAWAGRVVADNAITICMARLRRALGEQRGERKRVVTIYGRGYRFAQAVHPKLIPVTSAGPGNPTAETELVGRDTVLAPLQRALSMARGGRGRLCALLGEAGIGKTRVTEAFLAELPGDVLVSWGYCREANDTPPFLPWQRILREVLGRARSEGRAPTHEVAVVEAWLNSSRATQNLDASQSPWLPWQQRQEVFEAIVGALRRASERTPLVLVLEDFHRADAVSVELLGMLVEELAQSRILIVTTVRPTEIAEAAQPRLSSILGHANTERIPLRRFHAAETQSYAAAYLGRCSDELAQQIHRMSEGVPFFVVEICRQVLLAETRDGETLVLPDTALGILHQRVARLDGGTRKLLSAASAVGRSFELSWLRELTEQDMSAVMHGIDSALGADVLTRAPDAATAYTFSHELLRHVLYNAMPPAERRQWHARVARVLGRRIKLGESIAAADLAYQLHAALPDSEPRDVVEACRTAAGAAASVFAGHDVLRALSQALEALDLMPAPSLRLRMHFLYLSAIYARAATAGRYEAATFELARLARMGGDLHMLVRAAVMYNLHPGFRQLANADRELEHALKALPADDRAMRAVALGALAMSTPTCFDAMRSGALAREAWAESKASGAGGSMYVAGIAALQLRGGPDHADEASEVLGSLESLAQARPGRTPALPLDLAIFRAVRAYQRGDLGEAKRALDAGAAHARRVNHAEMLWHMERMRLLLAIETRESTDAAVELVALHERGLRTQLFGVRTFCAFDVAVLLSPSQNRTDAAAPDALAFDAADPPTLWALKVRALAAAGHHSAARASLRMLAPGQLSALPCDRDYLGTLGHIGMAAVLLDDPEYVSAAAVCLAGYPAGFAANIGFACEGSVPHVRGLLLRALGEHAEARTLLEQGLHRDAEAGLVLCAERAHTELGQSVRRPGSPRSAPRSRRPRLLASPRH
jgi:DNA-binding winged helix-turn-helix (wHTH) protein